MRVARRAFELAGAVMFSLFVLVGSGLIVDGAVLMLAAAGLALPTILGALLTGLWRPAPEPHHGHPATPRPRIRRRFSP